MIAEALAKLGFDWTKDFRCQDDGDGPYLAEWLSDRPRPTDGELAAALGEMGVKSPEVVVEGAADRAIRREQSLSIERKESEVGRAKK